MADKTGLDKYILTPENKKYGDVQAFVFRGKDVRGFEFGVQQTPVEAPFPDIPYGGQPYIHLDHQRQQEVREDIR